MTHKHLVIIQQTLTSLQLTRMQVAVKSLSSGFHQHTFSVHYANLTEQKRLVHQNDQLLAMAKRLNYSVVDTLAITTPMYLNFYPGKCSCHFHQTIPVACATSHLPKVCSKTDEQHYQVVGKVNSLYSEILLNQICSHKDNLLQ